MKNYFLLVVFGLFLASCKKDFTCTCKVPASGAEPEKTCTYDMKEVKKSQAKNSCKEANDVWILAGGNCELEK